MTPIQEATLIGLKAAYNVVQVEDRSTYVYVRCGNGDEAAIYGDGKVVWNTTANALGR